MTWPPAWGCRPGTSAACSPSTSGASPDQLASSRRTHFARRLLDDTDLTVTDIAYASGFGSLRQLNRACQDVFRSSPSELRARRRVHGPPGGRRRPDPPPALRGPARLGHDARLLRSAGGTGVETWLTACTAARSSSTARPACSRSATGARPPAAHRPPPSCRRAHPRGAAGPSDLRPRPRPAPGRRAPGRRPDHRAVGARSPRPAGARHVGPGRDRRAGHHRPAGQRGRREHRDRRAGRASGHARPGLAQLGLTHTFPTAAELAQADLGSSACPRRERPPSPRSPPPWTRAKPPSTAAWPSTTSSRPLCAVRGVGPWTAHYLALRLGEPDALPVADLGLRRAARPCAPLTTAALAEASEAWRPWRSTAALRLWLSEPAA